MSLSITCPYSRCVWLHVDECNVGKPNWADIFWGSVEQRGDDAVGNDIINVRRCRAAMTEREEESERARGRERLFAEAVRRASKTCCLLQYT